MTELTRDDVTVLSEDAPGRWNGTAWHIRIGEKFYIISATDGLSIPGYHTSETTAFAADEAGHVENFTRLAMVEHKDHWDCIDQLLSDLGRV
jgi:hypothetical protein